MREWRRNIGVSRERSGSRAAETSGMSLSPLQSVDENLRLWGEMQLGSEEGIKCCVRAK
ncbi:MAG: hypothetical protein SGPRY_009569, partial [Prymnesium sp.]